MALMSTALHKATEAREALEHHLAELEAKHQDLTTQLTAAQEQHVKDQGEADQTKAVFGDASAVVAKIQDELKDSTDSLTKLRVDRKADESSAAAAREEATTEAAASNQLAERESKEKQD